MSDKMIITRPKVIFEKEIEGFYFKVIKDVSAAEDDFWSLQPVNKLECEEDCTKDVQELFKYGPQVVYPYIYITGTVYDQIKPYDVSMGDDVNMFYIVSPQIISQEEIDIIADEYNAFLYGEAYFIEFSKQINEHTHYEDRFYGYYGKNREWEMFIKEEVLPDIETKLEDLYGGKK